MVLRGIYAIALEQWLRCRWVFLGVVAFALVSAGFGWFGEWSDIRLLNDIREPIYFSWGLLVLGFSVFLIFCDSITTEITAAHPSYTFTAPARVSVLAWTRLTVRALLMAALLATMVVGHGVMGGYWESLDSRQGFVFSYGPVILFILVQAIVWSQPMVGWLGVAALLGGLIGGLIALISRENVPVYYVAPMLAAAYAWAWAMVYADRHHLTPPFTRVGVRFSSDSKTPFASPHHAQAWLEGRTALRWMVALPAVIVVAAGLALGGLYAPELDSVLAIATAAGMMAAVVCAFGVGFYLLYCPDPYRNFVMVRPITTSALARAKLYAGMRVFGLFLLTVGVPAALYLAATMVGQGADTGNVLVADGLYVMFFGYIGLIWLFLFIGRAMIILTVLTYVTVLLVGLPLTLIAEDEIAVSLSLTLLTLGGWYGLYRWMCWEKLPSAGLFIGVVLGGGLLLSGVAVALDLTRYVGLPVPLFAPWGICWGIFLIARDKGLLERMNFPAAAIVFAVIGAITIPAKTLLFRSDPELDVYVMLTGLLGGLVAFAWVPIVVDRQRAK
jgi:hypothetical protein